MRTGVRACGAVAARGRALCAHGEHHDGARRVPAVCGAPAAHALERDRERVLGRRAEAAGPVFAPLCVCPRGGGCGGTAQGRARERCGTVPLSVDRVEYARARATQAVYVEYGAMELVRREGAPLAAQVAIVLSGRVSVHMPPAPRRSSGAPRAGDESDAAAATAAAAASAAAAAAGGGGGSMSDADAEASPGGARGDASASVLAAVSALRRIGGGRHKATSVGDATATAPGAAAAVATINASPAGRSASVASSLASARGRGVSDADAPADSAAALSLLVQAAAAVDTESRRPSSATGADGGFKSIEAAAETAVVTQGRRRSWALAPELLRARAGAGVGQPRHPGARTLMALHVIAVRSSAARLRARTAGARRSVQVVTVTVCRVQICVTPRGVGWGWRSDWNCPLQTRAPGGLAR